MEPNFKSMDSTQGRYNETINWCKEYVLMMEERRKDQEDAIMQAEYNYSQERTAKNKNKGKTFRVIDHTLPVWTNRKLSY